MAVRMVANRVPSGKKLPVERDFSLDKSQSGEIPLQGPPSLQDFAVSAAIGPSAGRSDQKGTCGNIEKIDQNSSRGVFVEGLAERPAESRHRRSGRRGTGPLMRGPALCRAFADLAQVAVGIGATLLCDRLHRGAIL